MDPTDPQAVKAFLAQHKVDAVANLIAATNVDACEADPQSAYRANVQVVSALAQALETSGGTRSPHLIHISTDQVYDGSGPHNEQTVAPCNVYGLSKLAGEFAAIRAGATILRTNFIGRSRCEGRTSLTDWLVNALQTGKSITVFDDVLFSAVHAQTLCNAILTVIDRPIAGTFNLGCADGASKAHLAFGLAERLGLDRSLMTVGCSADLRLRARRPNDMRMNATQFEQAFDFALPSFESQIDLTAKEY
jgi:dTDP-4-dehydrorhamnose reductase